MGGDCNIVFDFSLDKTVAGKPKPKRPSKQSAKISHLLHSVGLVDIWREINPHVKDYTHFSAPHNSYARIDQSTTVPLTLRSKIVDTPLSDHSIISLVKHQTSGTSGPFRWRLNEALLSNPIQCTLLEWAIKEYFLENDPTCPQPPNGLLTKQFSGKSSSSSPLKSRRRTGQTYRNERKNTNL